MKLVVSNGEERDPDPIRIRIGVGNCLAPADCKSAIQQITNLRYGVGLWTTGLGTELKLRRV
jgi:hypothetical protein